MAARRRLEAGVGAEHREIGPGLLESPVGARVGAAIAQAARLAGGDRQRAHRAKLPGERRKPSRERQSGRIRRQCVLSGVRASASDVRRELGTRSAVSLNRAGGEIEPGRSELEDPRPAPIGRTGAVAGGCGGPGGGS